MRRIVVADAGNLTFRFAANMDLCYVNRIMSADTQKQSGSSQNSEMNESERVAAYLTLYKAQMGRFESTMKFRWQVNFCFWAFLASIIYAAKKDSVPFDLPKLVFAIPIFHCVWLLIIQCSMNTDKKLFMEYRQGALNLMKHQSQFPVNQPTLLKSAVWVSLECSITVILSMVACAVFKHAP